MDEESVDLQDCAADPADGVDDEDWEDMAAADDWEDMAEADDWADVAVDDDGDKRLSSSI